MAIRFVADSACDLDSEFAAENNIVILPMRISFGDEEFMENVTLSNEEFYARLEANKQPPKTSLVNQYAWEQAFNDGLAAGDKVIAVTLSEKLSGTHNAAKMAKETLGSPDVFLIDSAQVSFSIAALIIEGVKMAKDGKSVDAIYERLNALKNKVRIFACINSLRYLKEGGRMSAVAALVGSLVNIKPIVTMKNGIVANIGKAIGAKKAHLAVMNKLKEEEYDENMPVYFGHGNAKSALLEFMANVKQNFKILGGKIFKVGSTVGTYAGPGSVAITFFKK